MTFPGQSGLVSGQLVGVPLILIVGLIAALFRPAGDVMHCSDIISLADIFDALKRIEPILEAMDQAMSADGLPDGKSDFGKALASVEKAIFHIKAIDEPDSFQAFINDEGLLQAGSEKKTTILDAEDIVRIKGFGIF